MSNQDTQSNEDDPKECWNCREFHYVSDNGLCGKCMTSTTQSNEDKKMCTKCNVEKPISEFHRDKSRKDGRGYKCRKCESARDRSRYVLRKDRIDFKQNKAKAVKLYREANPEKTKAHLMAQRLKSKLKKTSCEECDETNDLHMHHPDYNKPLYVVTLCRKHHEIAHHGVMA